MSVGASIWRCFFSLSALTDYLTIGLIIVGSLAAGWMFLYVVKHYISGFAKRTSTTLDDEIVKAINLPICIVFAFVGVILSMPYIEPALSIEHSVLTMFYNVAIVGLVGIIVYKVFHVAIIVYGASLAKKTQTKIDDVLIPIISKIGKIAIVSIVFLLIMGVLGIDVTAPLAGMGIIGLAVAFAAQDTISNFLAGFFLMTDRLFEEGDLIQLPTGELCQVDNIGIRRTRLCDVNSHNCIIVPNFDLSKWKIVNWNLPDKRLRLTTSLTLYSDKEPDTIKSILLTAIAGCSSIAKNPEPEVFLTKIASNSSKFEIVFWVDDYQHRNAALDEINKQLRTTLIQKEIKFE